MISSLASNAVALQETVTDLQGDITGSRFVVVLMIVPMQPNYLHMPPLQCCSITYPLVCRHKLAPLPPLHDAALFSLQVLVLQTISGCCSL